MFSYFCCARGVPTVCVTFVWAGVDKVWEQEKLRARKKSENAAESHTSGVRYVGWQFCKTHRPSFLNHSNTSFLSFTFG